MNEEKLEIMRHSGAHIMAAAIYELFPDAKFGTGPAIEDGFYYDIDLPRTLIPEDLPNIEAKMKEIIKANHSFERKEISREKAIELFKKAGQNYKVELLEEKDDSETISIYKSGNFVDLCTGPHLDSTGEMKAFKLDRIAGAYWRADEKNKMMQRIYSLAFETNKDIRKFEKQREEAKKRDHRKLGKELDLFTFSDLVGKGLPLFTPKGATIKRILERYIIDEEIKRGYQHVCTQDLAKVDLYKKSGHYPYYKDTMYPAMKVDGEELILRPMACPHHFELYKSSPKSYRDMPMRIAEVAKLYRYEKSGELTGLIRVRDFCLADSHIICKEDQAKDELKGVLKLIDDVSAAMGLKKGENYRYRLSLGNRNDTEKYFKNDKAWDESEKILREVLEELKAPFFEVEDEAAFYGPKIDIQMKNVNGKEDTAFTVQYDFCMPEKFDLTFKNEKGEQEKAVVIHRSSIGSIERTIGFLIEHYAGAFPTWLAPVQMKILPVADKFNEAAQKLAQEFRELDLRPELDLDTESVGKKIRQAQLEKVPYMLVFGEKEEKSDNLAVRSRVTGKTEEMSKDDFVKMIKKEISAKK